MTQEEATQLLRTIGYLYDDDEVLELNMNDVWAWALAWGEPIPADKVVEVAELFRLYGWCGLLYWVSEQHDQMRSEFEDNNRMIDFVRHEETLRQTEPDDNKRAYTKLSYTLGGPR
jgi:hypothetical protein